MDNISKYASIISRYLILILGIFYAAVYVVSSIARIFYPYAILNVEGASFQVLSALNSGYPIYGEPNIHYISIVYTPLYFIISYIISLITGFGYLPLRLLSFVSSIGIFFLVYLFIYKETNDRFISLISALFYILINPLSGSWLDLAKPDSLMLLMLLISFYIIRFKKNYIFSILAGVLIAISYMIKQQALSISLVILLYLFIVNIKKAITVFLSCFLTLSISYILLNTYYNGWFAYFTFILPSSITYKTIVGEKLFSFLVNDNISLFPILISFIVLYFIYNFTNNRFKTTLFYLALYIGFMIGVLPTRIIYGGSLNSLMPYYTMITILGGISISRLLTLTENNRTNSSMVKAIIYVLLAFQFIMHIYNPLANIPKQEHLKENEVTVRAIESYKGEVFVSNYGQLAIVAGKQNTPHFGTIDDILIGDRGTVRDEIKSKFIKAFNEKYYSAVFLEENWLNYDFESEIKDALEKNYINIGTDPSHRFEIYEPR